MNPAWMHFLNSVSNQDFADANSVISFYGAGGLGLPERDYYTRTDAKSVEQRQQYVEHVHKILAMGGEPDAQAAKDAETVLNLETVLAKASLTITEQRDPQNLNHPTEIGKFDKELSHFALAKYVAAAHAPESGKMNDTEPKFFAAFNGLLGDTPLDQIKAYLRWHLLHAFANTSMPQSFEEETWNFYAHTLNGAEKQQERWKRCTSRVDREMGEALGQVYVAKYFPPEAKDKALEMTLAIEQAMDKDIDKLDWMSAGNEGKGEREAAHCDEQDRVSRKSGATYSKLEIQRGELRWGISSGCGSSTSIANWRRSGSRSTRLNGSCHRPP